MDLAALFWKLQNEAPPPPEAPKRSCQQAGPSVGFFTQSAMSKKTMFGQLARQDVKSRATLLDVMSRNAKRDARAIEVAAPKPDGPEERQAQEPGQQSKKPP